MKKLYQIILLFVGLIVMDTKVQAQSSGVLPYLGVAQVNADSLTTEGFLSADLNNESSWEYNPFGVFQVINFTNYPNPAATSTTIAYQLTDRANVSLRVIDLAGKQLAVLISKQAQDAGKKEFFWELSKNNITSGMYILVLQVDNKNYSRKIIVQ
ncbi:T9SS type A sorting domain-containing protein [Pedobacter sp. KR3-3]|uniref:T9SS type A sorting domain-containing protein n=1 Tax=Pedobacter albus TaxID=3113905 RepID=A0ABU7I6F5_9SPHI|nr:T9SS type A sorting domain-containing protein [Pedobacter sp. KR3-3]MEE1945047.1 T9SS type A sorting domain-containing protein [Pedobacter sp. KR3-3]